MKVVVCQGETTGYPTRDALVELWKEEIGKIPQVDELVVRENFDYAKIDEIAEDADALIGVWIKDEFYTDEFFDRHKKLKYIATTAHGFGKIDAECAKRHGVTFTNTIYGNVTIAQYAMALLMNICHRIDALNDMYREACDEHKNVMMGRNLPRQIRQIELYEKTIGIIGLGAIGLCMARMAAGFGMKVIAYNHHKKTGPEYDFVEQVSFDELLRRSDVISIHCPSTDETRGMIDKNVIAKMKDGVILINTARGDIIVESDLADALNSGKIYAAGLDVVCNEPISERIPLMDCPNAIITPHMAWAPAEARYRTVRIAAENLRNWIEGHPTSVINGKG